MTTNSTRQNWLKQLKRGDKIWIAHTSLHSIPPVLTEQSVFGGWFDLKGSKGKHCLLACEYGGAMQTPKAWIFASKEEALIYAIPIVYRKMDKEINALNKAQTKLLDSYHKLLKIEF